jgi:hypothetical protein
LPYYTFLNKETNEETYELMSYSVLEQFLLDNPHLTCLPCAPKIISGVDVKPNNNFNDRLKDIKKSHLHNTVKTF